MAEADAGSGPQQDAGQQCWSPEAESGVVGSLLLRPELLPEVEAVVGPDDFYGERPRTIFVAVQAMTDRRQPVDAVTLYEELRSSGSVDRAGGPEYLARAFELVPTPMHAIHYAGLVRDWSVRRKADAVLREAEELVRAAAPGQAVEQVLAAQASLYALVERHGCAGGPAPLRDGLRTFFTDLEERMRRGSALAGMATGYTDLDQHLSGLQAAQMLVVAARPSMGKSSLGKGMALGLAGNGYPTAVFPVEDGKERFVQRCVSEASGVAAERIRSGQLDDEQFELIFRAADQLSKVPLFVDDSLRTRPSDIRRRLLNLRRAAGVKVAVVDYLQKLLPDVPHESREREIAEMSGELKEIAKETGVSMVVLAQLNRDLERRANKRPMLSDLRESGAIEQDADAVLFVYRDEVYNEDTKDKGIAEVIVAKGRDCGTGTVRLQWDPACVRFRNLARSEP